MRIPALYTDPGSEESDEEALTYEERLNEALLARDVLDRKHEQEEAEKEAMRKLRLAMNYAPFIGNATQPERKDLFNRAVRNRETTISGILTFGNRWYQSPYNGDSWRDLKALELVTTPMIAEGDDVGPKSGAFKRLYTEIGTTIKTGTYSGPEIGVVRATHVNSALLREILYGTDMLLMKITPLDSVDELMLKQIYNEIRIQYSLNELLYGYTNVLSVHFPVLVDWFQTSHNNLDLHKEPGIPRTYEDDLYGQVTIAEYADKEFRGFMIENASLNTMRVVLFQIFHALETAWHLNRFVHYDLHMGNLMMKSTNNFRDSPFYGRNLLYNRKDMPHWYALSHAHLGDHIVKIIDFGFSVLNAPKQPCPSVAEHLHDDVIGLEWPVLGMQLNRPNRFADLRMLLISLFELPLLYWVNIPLLDRKLFHDFVEDMLDFREINQRIDAIPKASEERRLKAGGFLRASNLSECPICIEALRIFGSYARDYTENGTTVTDALDHEFFMSLKRMPGEMDAYSATNEDVVVSFYSGESQGDAMRTSLGVSLSSPSSSSSLHCEVCMRNDKEVAHYNIEDGVPIPLCSELCAEFRYLYGGKTVFR